MLSLKTSESRWGVIKEVDATHMLPLFQQNQAKGPSDESFVSMLDQVEGGIGRFLDTVGCECAPQRMRAAKHTAKGIDYLFSHHYHGNIDFNTHIAIRVHPKSKNT